MKPISVHAWTDGPMRRFVADARVRYAVLLHPSGLALSQHGFTHAVDVMSACSLAAAIRASAGALGTELSGQPFTELYYGGKRQQILMAEAATSRGPCMLLTVFGAETSVGVVRLFVAAFRAELIAAAPPLEDAPATLGPDFEAELQRGLAAVFDRGGSPRLTAGGIR